MFVHCCVILAPDTLPSSLQLDLSPEDDQNRGEDIKISKNVLGETPFDKTTNHNTMDFII